MANHLHQVDAKVPVDFLKNIQIHLALLCMRGFHACDTACAVL